MIRPLHVTTLEDVRASSSAITIAWPEDWTRPMPEFVADLSDAGDRDPLGAPFHTNKSERFRTTLRDQLVFGFHHLHALIGQGEVFNCQNIGDSPLLIDYHINNHPGQTFNIPAFIHDEAGFHISYDRFDEAAVMRLHGPVVLGSPIEPENWGMWLLHGLPAAAAFVAEGQPGSFLCNCGRAWQRQLLRFMGVSPDKLIEQGPWVSYRVPEITFHQHSLMDFVPRHEDFKVYTTIADSARRAIDPPRYKRLFLSRRTASRNGYRQLMNEEALIAALEPLGFQVVETEFLTFTEQVALMNQAEMVAGLGGAAMFNTVFCRPGTKVVSIEGTTAFIHNHANIFAGMGHRYGFILGQDDASGGNYPHNKWTLDAAKTARLLGEFAVS